MDHEPRPRLAGALRTGAALTCLGIGAVGLLLPIVPGIPLLIVGALLLHRREPVRRPLTSALSRADLTPTQRLQVRLLLFARRSTMAAEALRLRLRSRRARQRYD